MSEDPAPYFTQRSMLDWTIDDACTRMRTATSVEQKLKWAKVMVDAKRARGDYDQVVQPPLTDELVDALARHEAQASVINPNGERFDD